MSENRFSTDWLATNPKPKKTYGHENYTEYEFPHILSAVRQVNGGSSHGRNEAAERRYSKRTNRRHENSSSDTFYSAQSSDCDSFKSAQSVFPDTFMAEARISIDSQKNFFTDNLFLGNSESHYDMATIPGCDLPMTKQNQFIGTGETFPLDFSNNKGSASPIKFGALYQSQEDGDLYCHPLKELIQKDPEWQKLRLRRKGTEVTFTPRSYYMNLDADDIAFEPNPSSTAVTLRTRKKKSKISKTKSFR